MTTETIYLANIKCSGCAASIRDKARSVNGVEDVVVNEEECHIQLKYDGESTRSEVLRSLKNMGYPEATEANGLLLKAKSYASCMVGRFKD